MADMTPKQARTISYISAYAEKFGFVPSETEIATAMGVTRSAVNLLLKKMTEKNLIRKTPGTGRSIVVLVPHNEIPTRNNSLPVSASTDEIQNPTNWSQPLEPTADGVLPSAQYPVSPKAIVYPIYRFRIVLKWSQPEIWRRIEVPDITLTEFHMHIMFSMGWTESSAHSFKIKKTEYLSFFEICVDEPSDTATEKVTLGMLVEKYGRKFKMDYRYGDRASWVVQIQLENVFEQPSGTKYPRCKGGENACPPELFKDIHRFYYYLEEKNNGELDVFTDEHAAFRRFDPKKFNAKSITMTLRSLYRWCQVNDVNDCSVDEDEDGEFEDEDEDEFPGW